MKKELSIEEVFHFLNCPLQYHFAYVEGMIETSQEQKEGAAFKEAMHQTLYHYYSSIQQGRMPTLRQLYDKLTVLWHEKSDLPIGVIFDEDPSTTTRKAKIRREKYLHRGLDLLQKFYQREKKVKQIIIAVNQPYRVTVGEVTVTGNFELIRERLDKDSPSRFIEVVDFRTSVRKPEGFFLRNDLHATFMHYAFQSMFKKAPDHFMLDYLGVEEAMTFHRTPKDYRRMLAVLNGVADGVANSHVYPRQGIQCKQCPFQRVCDGWDFK